ncbi:MAG: TetR/AcrR family transcriptional regulator [Spirochaetales bacterium]|nr:MAG: TetR/AcrR family transcriptional regulator [Spirochaetales bacterium]
METGIWIQMRISGNLVRPRRLVYRSQFACLVRADTNSGGGLSLGARLIQAAYRSDKNDYRQRIDSPHCLCSLQCCDSLHRAIHKISIRHLIHEVKFFSRRYSTACRPEDFESESIDICKKTRYAMTIKVKIVIEITGAIMPSPWSEHEKELIRNSLRDEGRRLFEKFGLQKTTVDQIVTAVRISKGAFYSFYPSKEELYFDIMETMEREFRDRVYGVLSKTGKSRKEVFREFMEEVTRVFKSTPLYGQLDQSDYHYLLRKLPEETLKRHVSNDFSELAKVFKPWMERGWMRSIDMRILGGLFVQYILGLINTNGNSALHFPGTETVWIEMMTDYLITDDESPGGETDE